MKTTTYCMNKVFCLSNRLSNCCNISSSTVMKVSTLKHFCPHRLSSVALNFTAHFIFLTLALVWKIGFNLVHTRCHSRFTFCFKYFDFFHAISKNGCCRQVNCRTLQKSGSRTHTSINNSTFKNSMHIITRVSLSRF